MKYLLCRCGLALYTLLSGYTVCEACDCHLAELIEAEAA